ncbi:MAG: hypothetical protein ABI376_01990 [Caulobacteraceae bacterium]
MDWLKTPRGVLFGGMGVALVAGLLLAAIFAARGRHPAEAPPASQGGLVVQTGRPEDVRLDPRKPLRCFVAGKLVGELPLGDCARRNGVATGALDVGLDPSGALAASNGVSTDLAPLPPPVVVAVPAAPPAETAAATVGAAPAAVTPATGAPCWRYAGGWRRTAADMSLSACVQTLYAGQCERPGAAAYGRWGERTLRRVPGRIEISADNHNFRMLAEQGAACFIGPISPAAGER